MINAIFSLVCGYGSVGESWIFLYAMQVCVYVCGFGGRRRGRGNGSRHENCKAKREKEFFLPFLFLSPRAKPNSWEEEKKKNPFSPCPTFDQQGLRFEEWSGGGKGLFFFVFWSSYSGFKSRSSAHKVSPACAYGGGIRTVCVHAKRGGRTTVHA